ncbi:hypothetical protein FHS25_000201 [Rhizobium laguerreae]|uniref:GyrI-like small molecule binding domain-containing protein n=1 Tax=Rhizobium laguerreae TaxID=1076926 RepID=A0ABR6G0I6_9HYPH|nr:hypothetical protein [Rhizobium laguerreae]
MLDVTIREIGPIELIGVAHTGSYMQIDKAFETLFGTLYARGLAKPDIRMIGVYLDDPDLVPEEKLRSIACVTGAAEVPAASPFERRTIDRRLCGAAPQGALCRHVQVLSVALCRMAAEIRPAAEGQGHVRGISQ